MARLPADPEARLARLRAARAEIGDDEIFTAVEMATAAGMSWVNLGKIIGADPTFPVKARGGMGVPWEFEAAKALDHMIAQAEAAKSQREARQARASRLGGLTSAAVPPLADPTGGRPAAAARDMLDDARALSALVDLQAKLRAEKVAQGLLLDRTKVENFLWRWLSVLQSDVLAIEGRVDKLGKLDPPARRALKDDLAGALVSLRTALEKQIGEWNAAGN